MPGQRTQGSEEKTEMEDPEYVAAQAKRYRHALLLLVDTIRRNQPSETQALIDVIREPCSVRDAAELLMRLSELPNTPDDKGEAAQPNGSGTQS
ncbi:hypothetical protein BJX70DRAFT_400205 [Aspergillus crustosus]